MYVYVFGIHACIYEGMSMYVCMHICICVYKHVHLCRYIYICMYIRAMFITLRPWTFLMAPGQFSCLPGFCGKSQAKPLALYYILWCTSCAIINIVIYICLVYTIYLVSFSTHIRIHTHMHTHIRIHTSVCTCSRIGLLICRCIGICICVCACIPHACVYVYAYA